MSKSIAAGRPVAAVTKAARPRPEARSGTLPDVDDDIEDFDALDAAEAAAGGEAAPASGAARGQFVAGTAEAGERLDKALARRLSGVSRSRLQQAIGDGFVRVNAGVVSNRHALVPGDIVAWDALPGAGLDADRAEPMGLAIVYQDEALIVLDKPAGLVVHPGAGRASGTLLNGLLAFDPRLADVARAGIVHRLDADTSGLMVIARTPEVQLALVRQLQERSVTREYWAIVRGAPSMVAGTIDAPLARDPRNRLRFHVSRGTAARPARTHWRRVAVAQSGRTSLSWIACRLDTGRTHQIRVHLESIGLPLVGDPLYRRGLPPSAADGPEWARFGRQALHASRLRLVHPLHGDEREWFSAPPADLAVLMASLGFGPIDRPTAIFDVPKRTRAGALVR
jgi:23S rRNA pseudouridine1911/1915/1917 synthase